MQVLGAYLQLLLGEGAASEYKARLCTRRARIEVHRDHQLRRRASCLGGLLSTRNLMADSPTEQLKLVECESLSFLAEVASALPPNTRIW